MGKLGKLSHRARKKVGLLWRFFMRLRGVEIGSDLILNGRPLVTRFPDSQIILKNNITLNSSFRCNPLGNNQSCVLRTLAKGALLELEDGVGISGSTICAATKVSIGKGTIIGTGTVIMDTDFHNPQGEWGWDGDVTSCTKPVAIGRGVFIGARSIILKGVTIGERAVVAAGSVVVKDVKSNSIVGGNPAVVLKSNLTRRGV